MPLKRVTPGRLVRAGLTVLALLAAISGYRAHAQSSPYPSNSVRWGILPTPAGMPAYMGPMWHSMLQAPQPNWVYPTPGVPLVVPQQESDADATGTLGLYQTAGATYAASNAFFQPLGTNGRACVTCHEPNNAFGLSLASITARYQMSFGRDPLFAPVDGATCPKNVPSSATGGSVIGGWRGGGPTGGGPGAQPYYTLLTKGLIRIPLPVPKGAQYVVQIVSDPYGCNTTAPYNQVVNADGSVSQILSVYRRPLISANLRFKTTTLATGGNFPPLDPLTGIPLGRDAQGGVESGNIMWDGREPTLASQAVDATLGHAQALAAPNATQVAQMVAFESGVYTAQVFDYRAGWLNQSGAVGGPTYLTALPTFSVPGPGTPSTMTVYNGWSSQGSWSTQASVYRGQQIFDSRAFTINSVAGLNNLPAIGQNFRGNCASCHSQPNAGSDVFPVAQHDIGVGGSDLKLGGPAPATDLPVFLLTCTSGATPYLGSQVLTNDPGKALITGQCADIGRMTVPGLRALAGHAPYFSDGSAPGLVDVVNFYNSRFNIGLSTQDKQDLVNFLATL